jgi:hypothetical protein
MLFKEEFPETYWLGEALHWKKIGTETNLSESYPEDI